MPRILHRRGTWHGRMGSRGQPEESRAAILKAAANEFAEHGIAGARTDSIAREARVNKALLYYYFKDKERLYAAVLDQVFGGLRASIEDALSKDLPPREKLLAYVQAHFDYIARHPLYPRIAQGEMMRAAHGSAPQLARIAKQYFVPVFNKVAKVIQQGQAAGDFRPVDPQHFVPSMIAIITFHFTNAPVLRMVAGIDPFSPERVAARRAAVLDFISAALFRQQDNSKGVRA
jgi:TetR/AcrR family transcriptional regulator